MLVIISLPFVKDRSSELVSWISRWPFPWSRMPSHYIKKTAEKVYKCFKIILNIDIDIDIDGQGRRAGAPENLWSKIIWDSFLSTTKGVSLISFAMCAISTQLHERGRGEEEE